LCRVGNQSEYRYKYQGREKDAETGMEAFELRIYDNRIGRWISTDPEGEFYDIIEYEGGSLDGTTDFVVNPYIKESFNFFEDNDLLLEATIKRVGIGEWKYSSEAIIPGHYEELLPIPPLWKASKYFNWGEYLVELNLLVLGDINS